MSKETHLVVYAYPAGGVGNSSIAVEGVIRFKDIQAIESRIARDLEVSQVVITNIIKLPV